MKNISPCMYLLACEGLSTDDDVGVARSTVFQDMRAGVGFKTGDFVKEKLGGLRALERLIDTYSAFLLSGLRSAKTNPTQGETPINTST